MGHGHSSAETLILLGSAVVLLGVAALGVSLGLLEDLRSDVLLPFAVIAVGIVLFAQQLRKPS
ncbi:MAG: hypothetical protein HC915_08205 [Anaerolineae bacterium]|nr:hypothetical protein [Anaerolineae bacterium]